MPLTTYVAGDVLTASSLNDNFTFAAANPPGGLNFISATTIGTGVSSVAVTSVFSSTFDSYLVDISDSKGNDSTVGLQIGGITTGYFGGGISVNSLGTVTGRGNSNAASFTNIGSSDSAGNGYQIQIINPNLLMRTMIIASTATGAASYFAGVLTDITALTGFTLTTVGTLTGGTIRVYGYAKS